MQWKSAHWKFNTKIKNKKHEFILGRKLIRYISVFKSFMFGILQWVSHQYLLYIISKSWKINWEQFTEFCFVTSAKRLHKLNTSDKHLKKLKIFEVSRLFPNSKSWANSRSKKVKFSYHVLVWFMYFFIFLMIFSIWIKNCQSIQRKNHNKQIRRTQNDCISPNFIINNINKNPGNKIPKLNGETAAYLKNYVL